MERGEDLCHAKYWLARHQAGQAGRPDGAPAGDGFGGGVELAAVQADQWASSLLRRVPRTGTARAPAQNGRVHVVGGVGRAGEHARVLEGTLVGCTSPDVQTFCGSAQRGPCHSNLGATAINRACDISVSTPCRRSRFRSGHPKQGCDREHADDRHEKTVPIQAVHVRTLISLTRQPAAVQRIVARERILLKAMFRTLLPFELTTDVLSCSPVMTTVWSPFDTRSPGSTESIRTVSPRMCRCVATISAALSSRARHVLQLGRLRGVSKPARG